MGQRMKYYSENIPAEELMDVLNKKAARGHEVVHIQHYSTPHCALSPKEFIEAAGRGEVVALTHEERCIVIFKMQTNLQELRAGIQKAYDKMEIISSQTTNPNIKSLALDAQIYLVAAELLILPDNEKPADH
jgi:hypothetical protein